MALRIRNNRIFCAALTSPEKDDIYIPDDIAYKLCAEYKVIVTESMDNHLINKEWWWKDKVPINIEIDSFYKNE